MFNRPLLDQVQVKPDLIICPQAVLLLKHLGVDLAIGDTDVGVPTVAVGLQCMVASVSGIGPPLTPEVGQHPTMSLQKPFWGQGSNILQHHTWKPCVAVI